MPNTATRLITLIMLLQREPNQKATDLAKELGVSVRDVTGFVLGVLGGLVLGVVGTGLYCVAANCAAGFDALVLLPAGAILGAALGLSLLFPRLPYEAGAVIVLGVVLALLVTNSYPRLEKWIIAFVSLIGLSFLFELTLVHVSWGQTAAAWVAPRFPAGSMPIIMAILGAVVMPHNIFLHSEIIQSRQWNLKDEATIRRQLKFEFTDTLLSMVIGWAINSAMILLAAATFFAAKIPVTELPQAEKLLAPLDKSLLPNIG